MPQEIEHIDALARQKNRDVLFVDFHDSPRQRLDWQSLAVRQQILEWLDREGFGWQPCGDFASTTFFGRYLGQIYIDIPFDQTDQRYQKVSAFLEKADGTTALPGVRFCVCRLSYAMQNAHHDAPGFWEGVAENL